jgi:basic membrane protein A
LAALAILIVLGGALFLSRPGKMEPSWRPGQPLAREFVKIAVIYIADLSDITSGYSHAHEAGIRALARELGLRDDQIIHKINVRDADLIAAEHAIRESIAQGANIILATSGGYMFVCEKLAAEHPGVVFAQASGNQHNATNLTSYFGRMYQARYLSGIVAGLKTRTNKIGFVAAMGTGNSEVTGGVNAFALGVESVNPQALVRVRVTHRWFDPVGEGEAARALIAEDCDVITQHSDTPGPQLAAREAGVWGIGYNSDMGDEAPEAVLTSVIWNWGDYYLRLVRSVVDGTFTTAPYLGGLSDGLVDLTPLNLALLPPGAAEAVADARRRLESGAFDVFEGEMMANSGRVVGAPGRRLSDEEILGGQDWYYRNVLEARALYERPFK